MDEETLKNAHLIAHPTRYKILRAAKDGFKTLADVTSETGATRELTNFHIHTLSSEGLLDVDLKLDKVRGKAVKVVKASDKFHNTIRKVVHSLARDWDE